MEIIIQVNSPTTPPMWRWIRFTWQALALSVLIAVVLNHLREEPLPPKFIPKEQRFAEYAKKAAPTVSAVVPTTSAAPQAPLAKVDPATTPVKATVGQVEEIDFKRFEEIMHADSPLMVDARSHEAFEKSRMPKSINLNINSFEQDFQREQSRLLAARGGNVVVFCSGESCGASIMVARSLSLFGFSKLYVYKGGWNDYVSHQMPIEQ